ncbi:M20 aminoacylase family protein [Pandoraea commovens]|uniref:M20 family metallopeptidase n=1 Tax=Pandoraea commovens TaxID=2508289 RepID=A0ABY5QIF2_9BURK|nr:M20 aminoacylase family protein [Pandoraea commovens]UVA80133.1 M20 family metallopeptidase [Pandoraea commovens]
MSHDTAQETYFATALTGWRHAFHRQPETGFEEVGTSQTVATILESLGLDVHRNIGGTGIVANLRVGDGKGAIGIRADMDALMIDEKASGRDYASQVPGKMHACGHDGHMSMVLGAAKLLAESRDFNGTVRFIFQPAEEHGRGAKAMIADGLLERFPIDAIYGVHNMPGIPTGRIATRVGGIMASEDNFVIRIRGKGTHAARPHMGIDPLVIGAQIVVALQTVVSRSVDPGLSAVVSCTEFITDGIRNAIPTNVEIRGDTRSYTPDVQQLIEARMRDICMGACAMHGAHCEFEYTHEFAPTMNWADNTALAVRAAQTVAGEGMVDVETDPVMASEDFGVFLQHVPGNFAFIGNGSGDEPGAIPLHNACYDFNDAILPLGARYFAQIVRDSLPR